MRALSERQVKTCEESLTPRCRCRCYGTLHGVRKSGLRQEPLLPEENAGHMAILTDEDAFRFLRDVMAEQRFVFPLNEFDFVAVVKP